MSRLERRRTTRFPIAEIALSSAEVEGEVTQISRTGVKLTTTAEIDLGRTVALRLTHGEDWIDVYGAVRWCRPAAGEGARFEVGIAFTEIGAVAPDSLWRSLSVYRADSGG